MGGLYVFVLGEEAESPIIQFIYSTQTPLAAGWLQSRLCVGGAIVKWFHRMETSDVGVTDAELTQVRPSNASTMQHLHLIRTPPAHRDTHGGTDKCTDMWTQLETPPQVHS